MEANHNHVNCEILNRIIHLNERYRLTSKLFRFWSLK